MFRTSLGIALLVSPMIGCGQPAGSGSWPPVTAAAPPGGGPAAGVLTGTPSCSNRGCHGDFERDKAEPFKHAYTTWLAHDPHTNAYRSLESKLGQEIGAKLGIDPTRDERCLACHMTPQAARGKDEVALAERGFGVGCESCHGGARDWLVPHREKGWKDKPAGEKEKLGLTALGTHAQRAEVCAGCHVGAPEDKARGLPLRDMNHDMIAAGHPRLMFEYGSYLANLPRHWQEKPAMKEPDRAWLVGQFASAKAALALLADRAGRAAPWPELAEHDCYACHHGLHGQSWRQQRGYSLTPGAAGVNRWYTALLPVVQPAVGGKPWDQSALDALMARRLPAAGPVQAEAKRLAAGLGPLAVKAEGLVALPRKRLEDGLLSLGTGPQARGWDEYEQAALGLSALIPPATLRPLLRHLAWPDGLAGPKDDPPEDYHAEVRKLFRALSP